MKHVWRDIYAEVWWRNVNGRERSEDLGVLLSVYKFTLPKNYIKTQSSWDWKPVVAIGWRVL
jgi:hypothetical protein